MPQLQSLDNLDLSHNLPPRVPPALACLSRLSDLDLRGNKGLRLTEECLATLPALCELQNMMVDRFV